MAMELIRFLGAAAVIMLPGIWLARGLVLGENLLERCTIGSSLGLALGVYLASVVSHIDLRAFYLVWGVVFVASGIFWARSLRKRAENANVAAQVWMVMILGVVGVIQFAIALPRELPAGFLDPEFHLILARQIQISRHAIDQWPFAGIQLNYPIGSHILVAIMSNISGLPVHTVLKDFIPLLGVITTAQMYVLGRRVSGQAVIGVYSAAIYGLWAWSGGIDYLRWSGLPNQLAMLLLISTLSIWLGSRSRAGVAAMAVCCAAMVLAHHHVMIVGGVLLVLLIAWGIVSRGAWKELAIAGVAAVLLASFFIVPYVMKLGGFHSTGILGGGEAVTDIAAIPRDLGYAITIVGVIGMVLCVAKKVPRHSLMFIATIALAVMYVCGEYIVPAIVGHEKAATFFTPSRFLADLNYFLAIFAAGAIWFFQTRLRVAPAFALMFVLIAALVDWENWAYLTVRLYEPPEGFVAACRWIGEHTPANTIVDDPDSWTASWTTYLCWREGAVVPLPISEPVADYHPAAQWIPDVLSGKKTPAPADLTIVAIEDSRSYTGGPTLWSDGSGYRVVQEWPSLTSSSSGAGTPARKPPGREQSSGPASR